MAPTLKVISDFIGAVGFPAFVAVLLLFEIRTMHRENAALLRSLAKELAQLRAAVGKRHA